MEFKTFGPSTFITASSSGAWRPTRAFISAIGWLSSISDLIPRITESPVTHKPGSEVSTTAVIGLLASLSNCAKSLFLFSISTKALTETVAERSSIKDEINQTPTFCLLRTYGVRYFIPLNQ